MKIRTADGDDVGGLVELWIEFMDYHRTLDSLFVRSSDATVRWAEYITAKLADERFRVLVADGGASLAGYVVASVVDYPPIVTIERYGFIQEIAVSAGFRRQGIARQLFEAAETWLLSLGVPHIEVKVDVVNSVSRAFWKRAGFSRYTETLIKRFPGRESS